MTLKSQADLNQNIFIAKKISIHTNKANCTYNINCRGGFICIKLILANIDSIWNKLIFNCSMCALAAKQEALDEQCHHWTFFNIMMLQ